MKSAALFALLAQAQLRWCAPPPPARGIVLPPGGVISFGQEVEQGVSFAFIHVTNGLETPHVFDRHMIREQMRHARQAGLFVGGIHRLALVPDTGAAQASLFVDHGGDWYWEANGRRLPGVVLLEADDKCHGLDQAAWREILSEYFVSYWLLTDRKPIIGVKRSTWERCVGEWAGWSGVHLYDWEVCSSATAVGQHYTQPFGSPTFRHVQMGCNLPWLCQGFCSVYEGNSYQLAAFARNTGRLTLPWVPDQSPTLPSPLVPPGGSARCTFEDRRNLTTACSVALSLARHSSELSIAVHAPGRCSLSPASALEGPQIPAPPTQSGLPDAEPIPAPPTQEGLLEALPISAPPLEGPKPAPQPNKLADELKAKL